MKKKVLFSYRYKKKTYHQNHFDKDIIRDIYEWYIFAKSSLEVLQTLNEMSSSYGIKQGLCYSNCFFRNSDGKWLNYSVRQFLRNQIYGVTLIQNETKDQSYKVLVAQNQDPISWSNDKNTHGL